MSNTVNVNFKMDPQLKKEMEITCENMGLSMSAAWTIFCKAVTREGKIPFEIISDPFYSKSNIEYLEKIMSDVKNGKAYFEEHELIVDED